LAAASIVPSIFTWLNEAKITGREPVMVSTAL
jgi:hypothetical protein